MNIWILLKNKDTKKTIDEVEYLIHEGHNLELTIIDNNLLPNYLNKNTEDDEELIKIGKEIRKIQKNISNHYKTLINVSDSILIMNYDQDEIEHYLKPYYIENNLDELQKTNIFLYRECNKNSAYTNILEQKDINEDIDLINYVGIETKKKSLIKTLFNK